VCADPRVAHAYKTTVISLDEQSTIANRLSDSQCKPTKFCFWRTYRNIRPCCPFDHRTHSVAIPVIWRIENITIWEDFNLNRLFERYGGILSNTLIEDGPMLISPAQVASSENFLQSRIFEYARPRIRRSLRIVFEHHQQQLRGPTVVSFDAKDLALIIDHSKPDIAFVCL